MGLRKVLARLRPQRIDLVLFELLGREPNKPISEGFTAATYTPLRPSARPEIDKRLSDKRSCYAFLHDGEIAHASWLLDDVLLPASFGFDPRVPVIGDCDTPPKFRGRRLYPEMLQRIASDVLAARGCDRVYILVSPDNVASIRGIEHAGGVRVSRLEGIRVAGLLRKKR